MYWQCAYKGMCGNYVEYIILSYDNTVLTVNIGTPQLLTMFVQHVDLSPIDVSKMLLDEL